MKRKRILIVLLSMLLVVLFVLLVGDSYNISLKDSSLTKIITLNSTKSKGLVSNEIKVVEKNSKNTDEIKEDNSTEVEIEEKNEEEPVIEEPVVVSEEEPIVYEGMTLNELASKLERSFKNELSGYGYLYAWYSLEKGVDPYLAAAISLEETGCNWNCSNLVKSCNNVGGMKGSGCGAYGAWPSLDDGIRAFIDNIYRNYVAYGLTTADTMNPKYAENPEWSVNVNAYIRRIRNT